jgi:hypothetical protein
MGEYGEYAPKFCDTLNLSAGRVRSLRPAPTKHHFINGAQKNTVLGPTILKKRMNKGIENDSDLNEVILPAGWFMKACSREDPTDAAAPDMAVVL